MANNGVGVDWVLGASTDLFDGKAQELPASFI
jgi:hypothetical protein